MRIKSRLPPIDGTGGGCKRTMATMKVLSGRQAPPKSTAEDKPAQHSGSTALYTYLNTTLKSPRLRRLLEEAARDHAPEAQGAGRA